MIRSRIGNGIESILDKGKLRRAPGLPTQVHLSVIDRCFLPCQHCDIWKNTDKELPTDFWVDAIDRLGRWCAPAGMNFVGGEPLMRTDLETLIRHAVRWGFDTSFNTNAWLVTPSRAKSIAESRVGLVYVSLDGFSEKTVDVSRGKEGSFQKALDAVELLQSNGVTVAIASVLHTQNQHEVPQLVDWVKSKGMTIIFQPLYQNFGNVEYNPDWWRESTYFPKSQEDSNSMAERLDWLTKVTMKSDSILNSPDTISSHEAVFHLAQHRCWCLLQAGHSDISIDPQGQVRLCYFLDPVGDLHSDKPRPKFGISIQRCKDAGRYLDALEVALCSIVILRCSPHEEST